MVKKTITICDICKRNDEEDNEAEEKCVLCKKDVCGDCWERFVMYMGEEDKEVDVFDNDGLIVCNDCIEKIEINEKKDKDFLNRIEKETTEYLKQKVMLGELAKG